MVWVISRSTLQVETRPIECRALLIAPDRGNCIFEYVTTGIKSDIRPWTENDKVVTMIPRTVAESSEVVASSIEEWESNLVKRFKRVVRWDPQDEDWQKMAQVVLFHFKKNSMSLECGMPLSEIAVKTDLLDLRPYIARAAGCESERTSEGCGARSAECAWSTKERKCWTKTRRQRRYRQRCENIDRKDGCQARSDCNWDGVDRSCSTNPGERSQASYTVGQKWTDSSAYVLGHVNRVRSESGLDMLGPGPIYTLAWLQVQMRRASVFLRKSQSLVEEMIGLTLDIPIQVLPQKDVDAGLRHCQHRLNLDAGKQHFDDLLKLRHEFVTFVCTRPIVDIEGNGMQEVETALGRLSATRRKQSVKAARLVLAMTQYLEQENVPSGLTIMDVYTKIKSWPVSRWPKLRQSIQKPESATAAIIADDNESTDRSDDLKPDLASNGPNADQETDSDDTSDEEDRSNSESDEDLSSTESDSDTTPILWTG